MCLWVCITCLAHKITDNCSLYHVSCKTYTYSSSIAFVLHKLTNFNSLQWFEELQQVSFDYKFPARQDPTITNSLKIKHELPKDKSRRRKDSLY